jgi:hypothetical protein
VELPEEENTPEKRVDRIFAMMDKVCVQNLLFLHSNNDYDRFSAPRESLLKCARGKIKVLLFERNL